MAKNNKESRQGVVLQVDIWRWGSHHLAERKLCYAMSRKASDSDRFFLHEHALTEIWNAITLWSEYVRDETTWKAWELVETIREVERCSLNWIAHIFWMRSLLYTYSLTRYAKSWRTYLENTNTFLYPCFNTAYVNVIVEHILRTLFLFSFPHPYIGMCSSRRRGSDMCLCI